jgi:uncharacterized protein (TIGR00369 family)
MDPVDPRLAAIFRDAPFIRDLGIELVGAGPGWCETTLVPAPRLLQQDGFVHAGVMATMADHTAGGAAGTLAQAGQIVLTVEFKINLLRPARGERLRCRAELVKPGKNLSVAESSVFSAQGGVEKIVAKAMVTLALVAAP